MSLAPKSSSGTLTSSQMALTLAEPHPEGSHASMAGPSLPLQGLNPHPELTPEGHLSAHMAHVLFISPFEQTPTLLGVNSRSFWGPEVDICMSGQREPAGFSTRAGRQTLQGQTPKAGAALGEPGWDQPLDTAGHDRMAWDEHTQDCPTWLGTMLRDLRQVSSALGILAFSSLKQV